MNAVGVADDVNTLVHEAGHAFHDFAAQRQPLIWQRSPGHEAAELASMSMELLASPYLKKPDGLLLGRRGALGAHRAPRGRALQSPAHRQRRRVPELDLHQRRGHNAAARDAAWLEIRSRFEQGIDWSGLDQERVARWYRQLHIFEYPFYYIEYGIAQMGALQVWRHSLVDQAKAVRQYREALALGGTKGLPEIYRTAGARLVFDAADDGRARRARRDDLMELRAAR